MKRICALLLAAALLMGLLSGCGKSYAPKTALESTLLVEPVENLPEDFILGMDVSSLIAEEDSGVTYQDESGQSKDLLQILAEHGITHIRVRVWNHPFDADGNGYGGGNNDIARACEIGKRAAKFGLGLIVDFHYSDFWADPGKQMVPLEWKDLSLEEKTQALEDYTVQSLKQLKSAGAKVAMVQVGNETNGALCGETDWDAIAGLMQAGARAVRQVFPEALVAVHFANPENGEAYDAYARELKNREVDYDVFASSYYPYWHGTLSNLKTVLSRIALTYDKKTMVMETSYAYTGLDTDFNGNTIGDGSEVTKPYPYTVQGQANSVRDVIDTVTQTRGGIGVCYWEGAWISVGGASREENQAKWEQFGSGWASSYAAAYDPQDAGQWYGGSAVDNQAFFDEKGNVLESLKVFNLVRYGSQADKAVDDVEDVSLQGVLGEPLTLPETVQAVYNDNSRAQVAVQWQADQGQLDGYSAGEAGSYEISGTAEGLPVTCYLEMLGRNYLENDSFETGGTEPWVLTDLGGADQLYVERKAADSRSGEWHVHFWSARENSVEFTLEQSPETLAPGTYRFAISIMGGDCGDTEIYAYAEVDGQRVATAPMEVTSYGSWDTGEIPGIALAEGQKLTVGLYVKCAGSGAGAWGKIDDAVLNLED